MEDIIAKLLSFIISLAATAVGAVAGIGGGMIIRPALTMLGYAKELSSFTSAMTVLSMSLVSLIGSRRSGIKFNLKSSVLMAVGSMLGGMAGASLLRLASALFVNISYAAVLLLLLLLTLLRSRMGKMRIRNPVFKLLLGGITGVMSGFFGIGGGPFQMTALTVFMGEDMKEAASSSIFITMLTTISSLATYTAGGYADLSVAAFTIPAGVIGGLIGSRVRAKTTARAVAAVFGAAVAAMLLLQVYNMFTTA